MPVKSDINGNIQVYSKHTQIHIVYRNIQVYSKQKVH